MAKHSIRIACAQVNPTVGDLEANKDRILRTLEIAKSLGVDIIVFPELCLTGYPPEDLLFKPQFVQDNLAKLREIASTVKDIIAIVGFVDRKGEHIFNAAAVIAEGKVRGVYHKTILPNSGVFDEKRYFKEGKKPMVFCLKGKNSEVLIGLTICEDAWHAKGPVRDEAALGAQIVLVSNASPFYAGKRREREIVIAQQAKAHGVAIAYVNLVGGQDELVFDGQSMIVDSRGKIIKRGQAFIEDLLIEDITVMPAKTKIAGSVLRIAGDFDMKVKDKIPKRTITPPAETEEVYQALVLGLQDYVSKNGFKKVVVGLSGGIDSSLVATLAVDALGRDNCIGVFMPSRYSSKDSETDAAILAKNLGIEFKNISIEHIYRMYLLILETHFVGTQRDVTEENLQARIRGNLLMAFSNKFGWLVLTTGNKSEMSAGYATLYGDMAGGFAVIKDVPKTLVYKLARYRNTLKNIIPERVFTKAPTAELKPNQKDEDTLPSYDVLDPILKAYVELDRSVSEIVAAGFDEKTVHKVAGLVDGSEYKRRQAAPGIKITPRAFGRDRRMPITSRYRRLPMTFELLAKRLTPKLRRICYKLNRRFTYFNEDDLFQEALLSLWKKFEAGALAGKTDSYILQGCSFALRNYIRTAGDRVTPVSIEAAANDDDEALEGSFMLRDHRFDSYFETLNDKLIAEVISNNGLTPREKALLPLFAEGLTVREIGSRLGISHVMVLKMRNAIRRKCLCHLDTE